MFTHVPEGGDWIEWNVLLCSKARICCEREHSEVTWYTFMKCGLSSFYSLKVQTEIDALYNAKIRKKAELELRIQTPPQCGCLQVGGCIWIAWSEPWGSPKCQKSQQQNEAQPQKGTQPNGWMRNCFAASAWPRGVLDLCTSKNTLFGPRQSASSCDACT